MKENTALNSNYDNPHRIRILLASCYPLILQALKMNIEKQQDMEIVAETGDSEEAVSLSTKLNPDIVFIDIDMPRLDGLEAIKQINKKCPQTNGLILTLGEVGEQIQQAGLIAYIPKRAPIELIFRVIRDIANGKIISGQQFLPDLIVDYKDDVYNIPPVSLRKSEILTTKELNILKILVKGKSNKEIADSLGLSLVNVKAILTRLYTKLGVRSRAEAITASIKAGIIKYRDLR